MAALIGQAAKFAAKNPKLAQQAMQMGTSTDLSGVASVATQMLEKREEQMIAKNLQAKELKLKEEFVDSTSATGNKDKWYRQALDYFMKYGVPYLTLFLVIFLLWWMFRSGSSVPAPTPTKRNVAKEGMFNSFFKQLNSIFSFGYESKKFFRMLSPLSGDATSIERPIIYSGRCNNMDWVETDGEEHIANEGEQGYCETTILPNDIKWKLDTSRMPEYAELPKIMRDSIKKQLDVIIPWDHNDEASFYVPQCDKAVFANTCDPKDPTNYAKCKKADLLEDNGMTCKLREQTSLMYKEGKRCNNTTNVGIVDPKNYRILTLLQRLQNKLDKTKTSKDGINVFVDTITNKDRAIANQSNNVDLPFTYPLISALSKYDPNYNKGVWNSTLRSVIPKIISEQETAKTEAAVTTKK